MTAAEDQAQIEDLVTQCLPTQRSAKAFALGDLMGVRMIRMPSLRSTLSKGPANLASRSWMRKCAGAARSSRVKQRLRAYWVTKAPVRVCGCCCDVQAAGADLDEEQHVEGLQECGLHGEEVTGDDALGLATQELAPGRTSPRGGAEAFAGQQPLDGARPDADAELAQLPLDPHVAPAWVVLGHAHDEMADLRVERRRPASSAPR